MSSSAAAAAVAPKRKLGDTDFEIPDSDDEDYGWQGDDEDAMPDMPPQWQGSEDLLLGEEAAAGDNKNDGEAKGGAEEPPSPDQSDIST